jgi:hypothetical protein
MEADMDRKWQSFAVATVFTLTCFSVPVVRAQSVAGAGVGAEVSVGASPEVTGGVPASDVIPVREPGVIPGRQPVAGPSLGPLPVTGVDPVEDPVVREGNILLQLQRDFKERKRTWLRWGRKERVTPRATILLEQRDLKAAGQLPTLDRRVERSELQNEARQAALEQVREHQELREAAREEVRERRGGLDD